IEAGETTDETTGESDTALDNKTDTPLDETASKSGDETANDDSTEATDEPTGDQPLDAGETPPEETEPPAGEARESAPENGNETGGPPTDEHVADADETDAAGADSDAAAQDEDSTPLDENTGPDDAPPQASENNDAGTDTPEETDATPDTAAQDSGETDTEAPDGTATEQPESATQDALEDHGNARHLDEAPETIEDYKQQGETDDAFQPQPRDTYAAESGTDVSDADYQNAQVENEMADAFQEAGKSREDFLEAANSGDDWEKTRLPQGTELAKVHNADGEPNPDRPFYTTDGDLQNEGVINDGHIDSGRAREDMGLPSYNNADAVSHREVMEDTDAFTSRIAPTNETGENGEVIHHEGGGRQTVVPDTGKLGDFERSDITPDGNPAPEDAPPENPAHGEIPPPPGPPPLESAETGGAKPPLTQTLREHSATGQEIPPAVLRKASDDGGERGARDMDAETAALRRMKEQDAGDAAPEQHREQPEAKAHDDAGLQQQIRARLFSRER
ncbi:MAG: hypothetical protein LBI02_11245, partial [Opitutaceae bacterium]|nr:hypothetical protein [Opitutaceae bacterium]